MKKLVLAVVVTVLLTWASAQNTHSVSLTWTQSPSAGVTSNNVYQASTTGGPYTLAYSSTSPITSYTVGNLPGSTTYYFVVTAVCSTCNPQESPYSNQASATTDANQPSPPSNLKATSN